MIAECDFFQSVPAGGSAYLLKDILHDWDDEHAAAILAVCRTAMLDGARLILVERSLPARVGADPVDANRVITDLQMMVVLGGRERTTDEFRRLFEGAGLKLTRVLPGRPFGLVEAVAV